MARLTYQQKVALVKTKIEKLTNESLKGMSQNAVKMLGNVHNQILAQFRITESEFNSCETEQDINDLFVEKRAKADRFRDTVHKTANAAFAKGDSASKKKLAMLH
jgi:predicted GNAT superfamily acetyltransferase